MKLERTTAGLEARLTPRGAGRFGGAAFLGFWLVFWVLGEGLVLWLLVWGGWALLTGQPPEPGRAPLEIAPSLAAGVFLVGWLAFWTLGGYLALHEFFRLVWSADQIRAGGKGIELARRVGVFTSRKFLPRDQLRRVYRLESGPGVQVETVTGVEELTRNGTSDEQDKLVAALTAELRLPTPQDLPPELPAEWTALRLPGGAELLLKNPAARRVQARVAWLIAMPLAAVALVLLREAWIQPNYGVLAAMLAVAAALVAWGAVRLTWARDEWRLESGRAVLQRRFGPRVREVFAATRLRLTEVSDSDGDTWFKLVALDNAGTSRVLVSSLRDPVEPRRVGGWLAARAGLSLADETTDEARAKTAAERAALQAQQMQLLREWFTGMYRRLPGFGSAKDREGK